MTVSSEDRGDGGRDQPDSDEEPAESLSGSITIILNPRWSRELSVLLRIANRLKNASQALLGAATFLDETAREGEPALMARWPDRLAAYETLLADIEAVVRDHEPWGEMPTAAETFGPVLTSLRRALDAAQQTANAGIANEGAATATAVEAVGQALGVQKLLLEKVVNPARADGERMQRAWESGMRLRVVAEVPGEGLDVPGAADEEVP
jgi:hypothetical protein